ncbi:MAG: hypothetical protein J3K34DRAFT_407864 [Monoraphidium minutum]|nr:MAG: hypothetical protein J3K34DRAFT_407864 [Monoraphidium minutum]
MAGFSRHPRQRPPHGGARPLPPAPPQAARLRARFSARAVLRTREPSSTMCTASCRKTHSLLPCGRLPRHAATAAAAATGRTPNRGGGRLRLHAHTLDGMRAAVDSAPCDSTLTLFHKRGRGRKPQGASARAAAPTYIRAATGRRAADNEMMAAAAASDVRSAAALHASAHRRPAPLAAAATLFRFSYPPAVLSAPKLT